MTLNDLSGKTIGQYELKRLLGVGGMGAVYEAFQPSLKRVVALKLLPDSLSRQSGYMARFTREAETAASLEHPHIVPIYDYGTTDGISYVAMRLLSGGSLEERLEQQGALPLLVIARVLKELASALDYAHGRGVVHRDIKPSNVMFDDHNNSFLVDFGIAKILEATQGLTQTGTTMGTPIFMSPEQWKAEDVGAASDQYAMGVLTYFLVTGQAPFQATTPFAMMHKHLNEMPPAVDLVTENPLHGPIAPVIARALAKSPTDRYATVLDFADAFEQAAKRDKRYSGELTAIVSDTPSRPMTAKPSRLPWVVAAIMTLLALGFMTGMIIALVTGDDDAVATTDANALGTATAQIGTQIEAIGRSDATLAAQFSIATQSAANFEATLAVANTLIAGSGDIGVFEATITALEVERSAFATDNANNIAILDAERNNFVNASATFEAASASYAQTIAAVNEQLDERDEALEQFAATATLQSDTIANLYATGTAQSEEILLLRDTTPEATEEAVEVVDGDGLPAVVSAPTGVFGANSTTSNVVGIIEPGTPFVVVAISSDGLWYQVQTDGRDGPQEGFVEVANVVLTSGTRSDLPRFADVVDVDRSTATPQVITGVVSQQTAIYGSPSLSGRGLGLLNVGTEFTMIGVSADRGWFQIEFENTSGQQTGYIQATNVVLYGNAADLPVFDN